MKLTHLRTNHITQPLGLFIRRPVFSWVAEDTTDKRQACAQIVVEAGGEIVYDSGPAGGCVLPGFEAPVDLKPRTRYQWTVTVWGDGGDTASASSWFETAKHEEPWAAQWIAADFADKETQPLLAKSFILPGEVESARGLRLRRRHLRAGSQRPEGRGRVLAAWLPLLRLPPGVPDLRHHRAAAGRGKHRGTGLGPRMVQGGHHL